DLITAAGDQWRRTAVRLMPQLKELTTTRWASHGELAFLLEGDHKEAAGGLRDVTILRGIGRAGVADTMRPAVRAANLRLLDTRDALHLAVGRRVDRLVAQERGAVAELLELDDGDALLRRVARDVVEQDGELVLARTAIGPVPDPSLSLRVAAAAATVRLPIARATSEWLAAFSPPLPNPWPPA